MFIFLNKKGELRAVYKILSVIICFILLTTVIELVYIIVKKEFPSMFFGLVSQNIGIIVTSLFFYKIFNKNVLEDFGLNKSVGDILKQLAMGFILGALAISFAFFMIVLSINGSVEWLSNVSVSNIGLAFVMFIFIGFGEEVFARGYLLNVLSYKENKITAFIVSAIIFSAMHGMNPNVSPLGLLNIFLVGLLFAYFFIQSGSILFPIGFHISWNFFQGSIYGFPVSGTNEWASVMKTTITENNIFNGGSFGPEGGLVTTFALVLSFLIYFWVSNRIESKTL